MKTERYEAALPIAEIAESPTNPRHYFDAAKQKEIDASVKEKGVIVPIKVRAVADSAVSGLHEIVYGARRFRAALSACLATIPALIVTGMTDDEKLEEQIIENLQREDLHPFDEADGFKALIDAKIHTAKTLETKLGVSKAYVYSRLKLTELSDDARKIFRKEKDPDVKKAELVARLKDPAKQLEAAKAVAGEGVTYLEASDKVTEIKDAGKAESDAEPEERDEREAAKARREREKAKIRKLVVPVGIEAMKIELAKATEKQSLLFFVRSILALEAAAYVAAEIIGRQGAVSDKPTEYLLVKAAKMDSGELRGLVCELLVSGGAEGSKKNPDYSPAFYEGAEFAGFDVKDLEKEAKKAAKPAKEAKGAKAEAEDAAEA